MKSLLSTRGARLACALTSLCAAALVVSTSALAAKISSNAFGANIPLHLKHAAATHVSSGSLSGTVVRTVVGLMIVIAVIYAITWIMRKARKSSNSPTGDGLTQVATMPLGPNRSVSLVRVGAELHLLGVAEHGITSIRIFTEEEAYELGLPFEPEDTYSATRTPRVQLLNLFDSLRRLTVR